MSRFSPEQQEIIHSWGSGMAVLAGAGSGKTTTLVAKCTQLVQVNSKARFAAVSFTERSASDLKSKLTESLLGVGQPVTPHWIMTIHGLCAAVLREFPREAGLDGEEVILTEPESQILWENAMDSLWMDDLPEEIRLGFELLLNRESRDGLGALLKRVKELSTLGVFQFLGQSQDPAAQALEKVAKHVLERFNRQKKRQGVLDFGDLEAAADLALESQAVRESYHRRFELVLVDEFQDTNPIQARIVRKFARKDASNLCVVGDPKQSIYRFRDADVGVFEEFCSQMPLQKSLTWNFRSVEGIIQFTNNICSKVFPASELRFDPLVPKRGAGVSAPVSRLNVSSPSELAKWIQSEIQSGIALDDFALLLRKVRGNEKWIKALQSAGIPVAVGSGGLFWEDPRIRELVSFLKWWDNSANSLSGGIFLRAPWMKISDELLDSWVREDPTWKKPFFESNHPLAVQLKPFLTRIVRPGELLISLLNQGGELESQLGASLLGLWHRVEDLSARGMDFHAVVAEISAAMSENRREREVPAPRSLGQLRVLTLHGAKGLEFPHVILIDFSFGSKSSDAPLLFWDRIEGSYLGNRDENGNRDQKNPSERTWRELEKRKNLAESKRLFYVALTRARERLILVCPGELSDAASAKVDSESVYKRDDWRAWIEVSDIPTLSLRAPTLQAPLKVTPLDDRVEDVELIENTLPQFFPLDQSRMLVQRKTKTKRPRHSVTEWNLLSRCPRAYEWTYIRPVEPILSESEQPGSEADKESELSKREAFQELGNKVHSHLACGDYAGLSDLENLEGVSRFSSTAIVKWAQGSSWMKGPDPARGRDVWTELPFEVPIGEEILVGSIDRIVLEDSRYSIIDFKVTERIKSVGLLLEAYRTQIVLYATALRRLDPQIQFEQVNCSLVNITKSGVQIVPVFLDEENEYTLAEELAVQADKIVNGEAGLPKTGPLCRFCEFRSNCPEGTRSLTEKRTSYDASSTAHP